MAQGLPMKTGEPMSSEVAQAVTRMTESGRP